MTYGELLERLKELTPEQLQKTIQVSTFHDLLEVEALLFVRVDEFFLTTI